MTHAERDRKEGLARRADEAGPMFIQYEMREGRLVPKPARKPDANGVESVVLYRTILTTDDMCECGRRLTAGDLCHAYDIGGGRAVACYACTCKSIEDGTARLHGSVTQARGEQMSRRCFLGNDARGDLISLCDEVLRCAQTIIGSASKMSVSTDAVSMAREIVARVRREELRLTREDAKHLTPTEHTPGPWTVDHDGHDPDYVYVMANESTTTVAAMHPAFPRDPRGGMTMADARLIASAPALLAACEDSLRWLRNMQDNSLFPGDAPDGMIAAMSDLSDAIAQARGSK